MRAATAVERSVFYLRAASVLTSALSGVTLMLLPDVFVYFVILVYAAILLWSVDAFLELRERERGLAFQTPPLVVGLVIMAIFSRQFVFAGGHLTEATWSTNGAYVAGTTVDGIQWRSKYSDVHVVISNDSDYDCAQVNLLIKPTYPAIDAALISTLPNVTLSREPIPLISFDLQLWHHQTGTRTDLPIIWFASTGGYRIRADVLPAHSQIEILFALTGVKATTAKDDFVAGPWGSERGQYWFRVQGFDVPDDYFLALHPHQEIVRVKGEFTSFYRHKHVRETLVTVSPISNDFIKSIKPQHK